MNLRQERQLADDSYRTSVHWTLYRRTMLDLVVLVSLAVLAYVLARSLPSFEVLRPWTVSEDGRNLGAVAFSAVLGIGILWFAYRRMRETRAELEARLRAEEALAEAQAWLQAAIAGSKVGIWDWDLQTWWTHYSDSWRALFGYTPAEVDGSQEAWGKLVHPDDLARLAASTRATAAIADPAKLYEEEFRLRHKDGTYRWVLSRAKVVCDAAGNPQRMVGVHVDISEHRQLDDELAALNRDLERRVAERTRELEVSNEDLRQEIEERKRATQELRKSEDRYRDLVEHSQDLIYTHDLEGYLLSANEAAVCSTGHSRDKLLGMNLADLLVPGGAKLPAYLAEMRDRGHASGIMEVQTAGGETRIWEYDNTLRKEGTAIPIVRGMAHDITDRLRADQHRQLLEDQLRQAQKMEAMGTLAGGIAHDFNNILSAIIGNAELARQDVGSGHPAIESLNEIHKASTRAKQLVQHILTFSRRQPPAQSVIALRPVVEEAVALLRPTLPAGVELATAFADDTPTVLADPTQVHQVLVNLCTNAWHAMGGRGGRIDICLGGVSLDAAAVAADANLRPGRFACLCVSDSGSGMDATTLERIFEPFFTTKPVGQGTGLGLSVVHGIVAAHGGAIAVRSERGKGTTFSLYFPAAEVSRPDVAPPPSAPGPVTAAGGLHVLYLDDEEPLVFLATRLLERLGYRVSGYTQAAEALAAIGADPSRFDLVVTDMNMPGLSGLEVARQVARLRPGLPVVLASGYITEDLRAAAPEAGVRELIYKPNTVEELCDVVQRLAGKIREEVARHRGGDDSVGGP